MWMSLFEQHLFLVASMAAIVGLLMGSFLNVVIYRLPMMLNNMWLQECSQFMHEKQGSPLLKPEATPFINLAWPNSHCPDCKHALGFLENIPVLSYILQKGQCKHCHKKIANRYPFVEILTAILTTITVATLGLNWLTWMALLLTWALIALSFIDLDHKILPDDLTLPFLWLGLIINCFFVFTTPVDAILGAVVGYLSFWSVYQLFKLITGKEGMGYGDFKLMALLGAWLGWQSIPLIIILSSVLGAIIGLTLIVFKGHDKSNPIPFGPYIALAGWIAMLWGDIIISKYFHYIGIQVTL